MSQDDSFPQIFNNFILLDRAGSGGMAEAFRAITRDDIGRLVIIKRCHKHLQSDPSFREMFANEIKITARLNHPSIVHVNSYGKEGDYIELEYVHGKTLLEIWNVLKERKQFLPPNIALYIAHEVAKGLAYAHELKDELTGDPLNIIHRDISPQNIMISYSGEIKILDFGIAKIVGRIEQTQTGDVKGKPFYMSPEQITNPANINHRSDIYSLGVVLWNLLTNEKLFDAKSRDEYVYNLQNLEPKAPTEYSNEISENLSRIVMKSLKRIPQERYRNMEALRADLYEEYYRGDSSISLLNQAKSWMSNYFADDLQSQKEVLQELLKEAKAYKPPPIDHTMKDDHTVVIPAGENQQDQSAQGVETGTKTQFSFKKLMEPESFNNIRSNLLMSAKVLSLICSMYMVVVNQPFFEIFGPGNNRAPGSLGFSAKVTRIRDLKKLSDRRSWKELLEKAREVEPDKRNKKWDSLVAQAATRHIEDLVSINFNTIKLPELDTYLIDYPVLRTDESFMNRRGELAVKLFKACSQKSNPQCYDAIKTFNNTQALPYKYLKEVAAYTTYNYRSRYALVFYEGLFESKDLEPHLCKDERLQTALDSTLPYYWFKTAEAEQELNKIAVKIAGKHCFKELEEKITSAFPNADHKSAFCRTFKLAGKIPESFQSECAEIEQN